MAGVWQSSLRRRLHTLFVLSTLAITPCAAQDGHQAHRGPFTPACAERELRALLTIEQFGETEKMSPEWLGAAGLSFLRARMLCLRGEEAQALALYDRIIAGEGKLSTTLVEK